MNNIDSDFEVTIFISYGQLWNVVDYVRTLVLDWSLELERAGVLGAEMKFDESEIKSAQPVTQKFIIQNVGSIGDISGSASVTNIQNADSAIDIKRVSELLDQIKELSPNFPKKIYDQVAPINEAISTEIKKKTPSSDRIKRKLSALSRVCEAATGNLTAAGVIQLIRTILGA